MQFEVRLSLSKRCSAIKNGYLDGDLVVSINGTSVYGLENKAKIEQVLDSVMDESNEPLRIEVDRSGGSFVRSLKKRNHGISYEIIDTIKNKKESYIIVAERRKKTEDKAEAILKFKEDNFNKTVIVSSPSLMQYRIYQYTPEVVNSTTEVQISQQDQSGLIELFLSQEDIEYEIAFNPVSTVQAKGAIKLASNKMKAKGYLEIVLSSSIKDIDEQTPIKDIDEQTPIKDIDEQTPIKDIDEQTPKISLTMKDFIRGIKKGDVYVDRVFGDELTLTNRKVPKEYTAYVVDIKDGIVTFRNSILNSKEPTKSLPIQEFAIKHGSRPKWSFGIKIVFALIFVGVFVIINVFKGINNDNSSSSVNNVKYKSTVKKSPYECKGDALEIAARVKTNIRAGESDYFYKIDLTEYKRNGCPKSYIMTAVKSL